MNYKVPKPNLRRGPSKAKKKVAAAGDDGSSFPLPSFPSFIPPFAPSPLLRTHTPQSADIDLSHPPTQWIEAYTRYNKEWIVVDVSRKRMRCRGVMEPPSAGGKKGSGNAMVYVVAFEEGAFVLSFPFPFLFPSLSFVLVPLRGTELMSNWE
jgi:hypothetical protein